ATPTSRPTAEGGGDAFEAVYRATLVNYAQGLAWRRSPAELAGARARDAAPLAAGSARAAAVTVPDTSVYVGRRWPKIAVPRTGFYQLAFSQFRRFVPFNDDTTTALDSLRLFTWAGSPVLPETSYCDTCGFREVAI